MRKFEDRERKYQFFMSIRTIGARHRIQSIKINLNHVNLPSSDRSPAHIHALIRQIERIKYKLTRS